MMKIDLHKKVRQTGTTLVELLVYLGLVTILLGVLTQMFVGILDTQLEAESTSAVEQDSRYILTRLTYDIQRADTVSSPATVGEESTSLQMTINGINYSFALNNGNLVLSRSGNTYQLNSYGTTVPAFTIVRIGNNDGKDTFQVHFTTRSKILVHNEHETKDISTTIGLR